MNDYVRAYERRKHLNRIGERLAQALPHWFPERARVTGIWEGEVVIGVADERDIPELQSYGEIILEVLHDYGVTSAARLRYSQGALYRRVPPTQRLHVGKLMAGEGLLAGMQKKALRLDEFNRRIAEELGYPFPAAALIANVKGGVITVCVNASAVATQVRYREALILEAARRLGVQHAERLKVVVAPLEVPREYRAAPHKAMSEAASKVISEAAESVGDDALGAALERLAGRLRNEE